VAIRAKGLLDGAGGRVYTINSHGPGKPGPSAGHNLVDFVPVFI